MVRRVGIVHADVTLTRFKVKEAQGFWIPKIAKNCTFLDVSSAILAWSSKLMVDHDSMAPSRQRVRADFPISF